jgi:hypothetical protein
MSLIETAVTRRAAFVSAVKWGEPDPGVVVP